jgi:hypothetical protein
MINCILQIADLQDRKSTLCTNCMKTLKALTIFISFGILSCNSGTENSVNNDPEKADNFLSDTSKSVNQMSVSDTLKMLLVDDYPVTNEMLADKTSNNSSYKKKSGEVFSSDKAWFTNDTLKQTLVFELYTDYHRLYIYHFTNADIPTDLIRQMQLYVSKSKFDNVFETATFKQKQTYFSGFINSAIKINRQYFTTKKGFKLGDKKEKAIGIYGNPDKSSISENLEKCEWKFEGDYLESEETRPKMKTNKPFAKDSFGYSVTMYFRNNSLIAMIIGNDIP